MLSMWWSQTLKMGTHFEGVTYCRDWENQDQDEQVSIPQTSNIGPKEDTNVWVSLWTMLCSPCMEGKPMGSHGK